MPKLAERYDVIVPGLRGVCGSFRPPSDPGYDAPAMAGDLHRFCATSAWRRPMGVGHDIGMLVAHAHAAACPDEVSKRVIMEGVCRASSR